MSHSLTGHCPRCQAPLYIEATKECGRWYYEIVFGECDHEFSSDMIDEIIEEAKESEYEARENFQDSRYHELKDEGLI